MLMKQKLFQINFSLPMVLATIKRTSPRANTQVVYIRKLVYYQALSRCAVALSWSLL